MRYCVIPAALIMQICLGATYSWSIYVKDLKLLLGLSQTMVQLPFSVFYFVFPATMIVSGLLMARIGPRASAILGGSLFGGGWLLSSLGATNFTLTILGNGLIAGIGAGIAYIVPIATLITWFPERKGLVTGLAVAGFGGGAALVSKIGGYLLLAGYTPFQLFGLLGAIYLVLVVFAGFFMVHPPGHVTRSITNLRIGSVVRSRPFLLLYFAMFSGLAAGFAVNANIKELVTGSGVAAGTSAVAFFALANAAGRVCWGTIFDRFTAKSVIQINLLSQAVLLLAAGPILSSAMGLQIFATLAGFNYGGVLVVYAGSVARIWGADRVAVIYGWLFSSNIPAATAPLAAAWFFDRSGSFTLPLALIGMMIVAAILLVQVQREILNPVSSAQYHVD